MSTYRSWGYDDFLTRTILIPTTQSPLEARNTIPTGSLSASQFSTPMNPTTTIVFSSTDYNTAAWAAGIIYFADGTQSEVITAGNTGNITATTYVYYDKDKSPVIQTTTTPSVATGSNKFMLAIVELGVSGKDCKITPTIAAGLVVSGIEADQIKAGTITATEIATGTITATQISGTQLDVVAANTGTLTVDESITAGGSTNGIIYVKDSSNNTKVQLDQDGIAIDSGKLTIKDDAETTVVDAKGVVSTAFSTFSGSSNGSLNQSLANTTETDITGSSLEFTLSRSSVVFVIATVDAYVVPDGANQTDLVVRIKLDATDKERMIWTAGSNNLTTSSTHFLETLTAATYTLKLTGKLESWTSAATAIVYAFRLTYIILGK